MRSGAAIIHKTVHGRKKGRPMGKDRLEVLQTLLPQIEIPAVALSQSHNLNPFTLFEKKLSSFWLEIGFGQGEHLTGRMVQNPDTGYLGAEPFINGVAGFLQKISSTPTDNIRLFKNDGMILARSLAPASLDGIYILNPDPWHKKRHHKRRIIQKENLDVFAKILKPNGWLILSTDVADLADWMLTQTALHPAFTWTATQAADWQNPPDGWITTRYETKRAKGGLKMAYLIFRKKSA